MLSSINSHIHDAGVPRLINTIYKTYWIELCSTKLGAPCGVHFYRDEFFVTSGGVDCYFGAEVVYIVASREVVPCSGRPSLSTRFFL